MFRQCSLNSHRSSSRLARASLSTHSTARQVGTGGRPPRHRRRSRIAGHPSYPVLGRRQAAPPMHLLLIQYCRQQSSSTESNPRLAPPPTCAFDACQRQQTRPQSNRRMKGLVSAHLTSPATGPGTCWRRTGGRPWPLGDWPTACIGTCRAGRSSTPCSEPHGEPRPQLDAARYCSVTGGYAALSSSCRLASSPVVFRYGAEMRRLEGEYSMPGVWLV